MKMFCPSDTHFTIFVSLDVYQIILSFTLVQGNCVGTTADIHKQFDKFELVSDRDVLICFCNIVLFSDVDVDAS